MRTVRQPPIDRVQGRGELIVGMSADLKMVHLQFQDPDWWVEFTPDEARAFGHLMIKKADELEADQAAGGSN